MNQNVNNNSMNSENDNSKKIEVGEAFAQKFFMFIKKNVLEKLVNKFTTSNIEEFASTVSELSIGMHKGDVKDAYSPNRNIYSYIKLSELIINYVFENINYLIVDRCILYLCKTFFKNLFC